MLEYAKPKQKETSKDTVQRQEPQPVVRPNTTGIPDAMKARYEGLSGLSFDDVKIHYNSDKPKKLNALAFTQGNQVHIAPGQEKHLSHELGHVVQQKQGRVRPTVNIGGLPVNDDPVLEREADSGVVQRQAILSSSDVIQCYRKTSRSFTFYKEITVDDVTRQVYGVEDLRAAAASQSGLPVDVSSGFDGTSFQLTFNRDSSAIDDSEVRRWIQDALRALRDRAPEGTIYGFHYNG